MLNDLSTLTNKVFRREVFAPAAQEKTICAAAIAG